MDLEDLEPRKAESKPKDLEAMGIEELEAYCGLVTPGFYILATDGLMQDLHDVPRGQPGWQDDNPAAAARAFVAARPEFEIRPPPWRFNESELTKSITAWPDAWIYRVP